MRIFGGENLKCKRCKNQAKLDSDFCTPCQKNLDGLCAKKNCNNSITVNRKFCQICLTESRNKFLQQHKSKKSKRKRDSEKIQKTRFGEIIGIIGMYLVLISFLAFFILGSFDFFGMSDTTLQSLMKVLGIMFIIGILLALIGYSGEDIEDDTVKKKSKNVSFVEGLRARNFNDLFNENNSKIKCRICHKSLKSKSIGERVAKGTAGIGGGTYLGMIVGTIILPGFGTLIGGGLGALEGSKLGSQTSDICDNCCMLCEKKKINCTCYDIIGSCGSCGRNITRFNSRLAYGCNGCYDHGEDI